MAAAMRLWLREAGSLPPAKRRRVRGVKELPPRYAANAAISATKMWDALEVEWMVVDMARLTGGVFVGSLL